jgi:CRP-like cAMP-binding protein
MRQRAQLLRGRERLAEMILTVAPVRAPALKAFSDSFSPLTIQVDERFADAGELEMRVGFLLSGAMRCFCTTEDGGEYTKNFFLPLSFIAAPSSLFQHLFSTVTIVAMEPTELLVIDGHVLERLYDEHPDLGRFARKVLEREYADREQKEYELAVLNGPERYRRFRTKFPGLEERLTQQQVASYLGLTTTQLGRIRKTAKTL